MQTLYLEGMQRLVVDWTVPNSWRETCAEIRYLIKLFETKPVNKLLDLASKAHWWVMCESNDSLGIRSSVLGKLECDLICAEHFVGFVASQMSVHILTCQDDLEQTGNGLFTDFILASTGQRAVVLIHDGRVLQNASMWPILIMSVSWNVERLSWTIKFPFERPGRRISMNFANDVQILTSISSNNNNFIGGANGRIWWM